MSWKAFHAPFYNPDVLKPELAGRSNKELHSPCTRFHQSDATITKQSYDHAGKTGATADIEPIAQPVTQGEKLSRVEQMA